MNSRTLISVAIIASLCIGLEACPYIKGCSFDKSDCTSLTCTQTIMGKTVYLTIKLDACQTDLTATITLEEYSSGIYFTHTFKGQGDIPIPGLNFGLLSANIRVKMYRKDSNIILEVSLVLKSFLTADKSITIVKDDLGRLNRGIDCGVTSWFSDQSTAIKALIIGGAVVAFLSIICCIGCCYCCCCKRDSPGVVVARANPAGPVVMGDMPQASTPYEKF